MAFQNTEEWRLSFLEYLFRLDISVSVLCKLGK